MSHFTRITAEIKDLEALKRAAANLNLSLVSNTSCRYYYGSEYREHVIKLPGQYDVAVEERGNGVYDLDADFYGGHVERYIGPRGSNLMRQYAIEKLKIEAKKNGYNVYESGSNIKLIEKKSGGKAVINFDSEGKIKVETSGFKGKSCMNFGIIEKALGKVDSIKKKPEFYETCETSKVHLKEWS